MKNRSTHLDSLHLVYIFLLILTSAAMTLPAHEAEAQEVDQDTEIEQTEESPKAVDSKKTEVPEEPDPQVKGTSAKKAKKDLWAIYAHKWNISAFAGSGYPLNKGDFPYHFEASFSLPYGPRLESGFYLGGSMATVVDEVSFSTTGYKEDRNYELSALGAGFKLLLRATQKVSLFANIGMTRTVSNLKSVDTTAPVPSTLKLGPQDGEVYSMAYRAGFNYEYPISSAFTGGGTMAYSASSSKAEAKIEDITVGAFLKFYWKSAESNSAKTEN